MGAFYNRVNSQVDKFVVDCYFKADFFQEVYLYLVSAIVFAITSLPSASEGICSRNPVNLVLEEFLLHVT